MRLEEQEDLFCNAGTLSCCFLNLPRLESHLVSRVTIWARQIQIELEVGRFSEIRDKHSNAILKRHVVFLHIKLSATLWYNSSF